MSEPTGGALRRPGDDVAQPGTRTLPDGRVVAPAGAEWAFAGGELGVGMTSAMAAVPGSRFVLTVDIGPLAHAVRAVDTGKIGQSDPVTAVVAFDESIRLASAIAFVAPDRVYVAATGAVVELSFDVTTGTLARGADLALPAQGPLEAYRAAALAAAPDGKHLTVASLQEQPLLVLDVDPQSPSYGAAVGALALGAEGTFAVTFDPHDPAGHFVYASVWGGARVAEIDVSDPAAPLVSRTFTTGHNPEGIAFLDARWMAVACDSSETVSLVDRLSGVVSSVQATPEPGLHGLELSSLAWDEPRRRLYALLPGASALAAWDVDLTTNPPGLAPVGRLMTSWWPSAVVVAPDGSLTVTNLRGKPIGPYLLRSKDTSPEDQMSGSIQELSLPTGAELSAGDLAVSRSLAVGSDSGYAALSCPEGVMDFPVPASNTEGPSHAIRHIVFVVRENKTFDALLGDLPGADGDPTLMLRATSAGMDAVFSNFRELARTFTTSDNFYNLAVRSTQGHEWTTYGRAFDFCERTWSASTGTTPLCGIAAVGRPDGGSLFEWLGDNGVAYTVLGESLGLPTTPWGAESIDANYPGGARLSVATSDDEKSCYFAGRERVACDLGSFVYLTLPNDHTLGVSPTRPTPETMCAVNDEATGRVVDAVAHSPFWASSLVVITEDDPHQGGDHVDFHRTPLVLVSPWIRRGYVSHALIDVASLHKLFAHLLGLPYANLTVKNAALPLDMFTSTPDYTPFEYTPRSEPLACGTQARAAERRLTESWDWSREDAQPGLGEQVARWMRGAQLERLPPRLAAETEERERRRAAGLPPAAAADEADD